MISWSNVVGLCELGELLDSELSIKQHSVMIPALCFYHLHLLRQIHRRVGTEVTMCWFCCVVAELLQLSAAGELTI